MKLKASASRVLYNKHKGLHVKDYGNRDCIICGYIIGSYDYMENWVIVAYSEHIGWTSRSDIIKYYIDPKYKESKGFLFVDFNDLKL